MNPTLVDLQITAAEPPEAYTEQLHPSARPAGWPWWLWPHLLGLDAPVVAMVWQRWWVQTTGLTLPLSREIILGLGVWLIYLADRLADSASDRQGSECTARHRFSQQFRGVLSPAACLLAATVAIMSIITLPGAEFRSGLGLLALAVAYFWLIHRWPGRGWAAVLPKEAVVGGMFSAGTMFFVVCRSPHVSATLWINSGLFAAVCFVNCALITKWEQQDADLRENSSLLNAFPFLTAHLRGACVLLATGALVFSTATMTWSAVPVATSALLLVGLDRFSRKLSTTALRILADVLLLTPLIGLPCLHQGR